MPPFKRGGDVGKFIDMTGWVMKEHGVPDSRLTVIHRAEGTKRNNGKERTRWLCLCECGNIITADASYLRNGSTRSCGCLHKEVWHSILYKHGKRYDRLYNVWLSIKDRCFNIRNKRYASYGGRGITICEEWLNFENFYNWAYSNGYNKNAGFGECTIDRIDVNGNYEPLNCRWVSNKEQCRNKTTSRLLTFNGKTQTVSDWEKETGYPVGQRINKLGWDAVRALTTPKRGIKYGSKENKKNNKRTS